jgi:cupin fold WbuC family metalloprotein
MGEVIFNKNDIVAADKRQVQFLKNKASKTQDGKARFCLHKKLEDSLHEMIIALCKDVYVRPHKHRVKTETFHLIEGKLEVIVFNDRGELCRRIFLNKKGENSSLLCRLGKGIWHTVIPLTNFVVFHEITNGPYEGKEDSIFAPWAPEESDKPKIKEFISKISGDNEVY